MACTGLLTLHPVAAVAHTGTVALSGARAWKGWQRAREGTFLGGGRENGGVWAKE